MFQLCCIINVFTASGLPGGQKICQLLVAPIEHFRDIFWIMLNTKKKGLFISLEVKP
jgi:hypothetical protein